MRRRAFLRRGLFGGALLLIGSTTTLALLPGDRSVKPNLPLSSISSPAFPVLVAVAGRVLAGTAASPADVAMKVDQALLYAAPEARDDLSSALLLLDNALANALIAGRVLPFTELGEEAQDRVLQSWRDSRLVLLRGAYHALRKLCLAAHYATPAGWPESGYPGPSIPKSEPAAITARGALHVSATDVVLPEGSPAMSAPQ